MTLKELLEKNKRILEERKIQEQVKAAQQEEQKKEENVDIVEVNETLVHTQPKSKSKTNKTPGKKPANRQYLVVEPEEPKK